MSTRTTTEVYGIWNEAGRVWIVDDAGRPFRTTDINAAHSVLAELLANGAVGVRIVCFHDSYPGEFSRMAESEARTAEMLQGRVPAPASHQEEE